MIIVSGNRFRTLDDDFYVNGKKVVEAYVNGERVYPERLPYTIKYKMRVAFDYYQEVFSWGERDFESSGYYEDTIRINSYWPMFVKTVPVVQPESAVIPDGAYDNYYNYSGYYGTEYIITPYPALYSYERGNREADVTNIYGRHSDRFWVNYSRKSSYYKDYMEIVMHRKVVNGINDSDTSFISDNFIRVSSSLGISTSLYLTYPSVTIGGYSTESLGFALRNGLGENNETYSFASCCRYVFGRNTITYQLFDRLTGDGMGGREYIPLFSGHMYREYNHIYRREPRDSSTLYNHVDLTSSFRLIENNNPVFGSVGDYVRYCLGG